MLSLQQTVLKYDRTTPGSVVVSPAPASVRDGGAKVTVQTAGSNPTVRVEIPGLSIDQVITLYGAATPIGATGKSLATFQHSGSVLLNYTLLGSWIVRDTATALADYGSVFATGFRTPLAGKPTTGVATYSGGAGVTGFLFVNGATVTASDKVISGTGNLTADFASNTLLGTFNNMTVSSKPWNDVTFTGSISGVTVSGTTALGSTPSLAVAPDAFTSATGTFNGGFFGPGAEELGIIWTLRDTSGSIVVGTFGGKKP